LHNESDQTLDSEKAKMRLSQPHHQKAEVETDLIHMIIWTRPSHSVVAYPSDQKMDSGKAWGTGLGLSLNDTVIILTLCE